MDFKYIIYTTVYWLWKHYLEQGHPISFRFIKEILSEKDFNTLLKDKYNIEYPTNSNEYNSYKNLAYSLIYPIFKKQSEKIKFLDNHSDTKKIIKSDLEQSEYDEIAEDFQLHLFFNYYEWAEPTVSPLKSINQPLLNKILFVDYYDLKDYNQSLQEFIKQELLIFKEILISQGLKYVLFGNELQSSIYHNIRHVNTSDRDIELLGGINYNIQSLQKEKEYYDYLNNMNEVIKNIENEEIRVIIFNKIKSSLKNRIDKTENMPFAPNSEWLETNWNSIFSQATKPEPNQPTTTSSDALLNAIVVKDKQSIIFNDIHIYFKQDDHDNLKKILNGETIKNRLEWRDNKTKLVTYFFECNNKGYLIQGPNQVLAKWIENNFKLLKDAQFDEKSILKILEDVNRHAKKRIQLN